MMLDALAVHRVAHWLYERRVALLPRALDYVIFLVFNSTIHHSTQIGRGSICGYRGMSILIHKRAVLGENVAIGAHVVIGGRSGQREAPVIGNDVYLGANCCVLGSVRIGDGATIGAGAIVLDDVPPGRVAVGNPARLLPADHSSIR